MYREPSPQMTIEDFILPFAGKLAADNRWVKLVAIIPWDEIEKQYAFMFPSDQGHVAKPVRMALGALIIQARCGFTDRETIQQIIENPYLQYFIGLREYQLTRPFTPADMVKFRKRFNAKRLADINEKIMQAEKSKQELEIEQDDHNDNDSRGSGNLEKKSEISEEEAIELKQMPDRIKVRPIVRGKAGVAVEFGAKVAISLENGYSRIEKLSWDSFNEAGTFEETVERYRERHGYYPEAVLADRIYRNRDNLLYCKKHCIRLRGPRLGRPPASSSLQKAEKRLERLDVKQRNAVEGKFGEGKRKYSLARVVARLKETAEFMIAMQFLVMNLEYKLRVLFLQIWIRLLSQRFETVSC